MSTDFKKYLPLTEATAYILLALSEPLHGYGVMQKVETISNGDVKIGPGTLYGAFSTLESDRIIEKAGEEGRRKIYTLTDKGRLLLKEHVRRAEIFVKNGEITRGW
jgi:DNA-binding PadR family transcriptional regulator